MPTPHCAQCRQPITKGRVLQYNRANCCEPCYERLEGSAAPSDEQLAADDAERLQAALLEGHRQLERRRAAQGPQPQRKEYKVLTQLDGFFSGVFTPGRVEEAINHYAAQGWAVVSMAGIAFPGMITANHQLLVLFERDYVPSDEAHQRPASVPRKTDY